MDDDEGEKTPPHGITVRISETSLALAAAGIALGTAASRLDHAAILVRSIAVHCAEASRLVDEYGPPDRTALLRDLEERLGTLADAIHETRRQVRASRLALEGVKP